MEMELLCVKGDSCALRLRTPGQEDFGDDTDVAGVEAVPAGDQSALLFEGVNEELVRGDVPFDAGFGDSSIFMSICGRVLRRCWPALCTIVCVPFVPFSFALRFSICSENLCDKLLERDLRDDRVGVGSVSSEGCPSS